VADDILSRTIELVRDHLLLTRPCRTLPEVTAESSFEHDLGCDAIDIVCIELAAEDAFIVQFPAEPFECCETVGDLAALVKRLSKREAA
jgi:acyl carrier protein